MPLILYPPEVCPCMIDLEKPATIWNLERSDSFDGPETKEFFQVYSFVLVKQLCERTGHFLNLSLPEQSLFCIFEQADRAVSEHGDPVEKIYLIRFLLNFSCLVETLNPGLASRVEEKIMGLRRGVLDKLVKNYTFTGLDMLLPNASPFENYMHKMTFFFWKDRDKKIGILHALGMDKTTMEREILADLIEYIQAKEWSSFEEKMFLYHLWNCSIKFLNYDNHSDLWEKLRVVQQEAKRAEHAFQLRLEKIIKEAKERADLDVIKTHADLEKFRDEVRKGIQGKELGQALDMPGFVKLFGADIGELQQVSTRLRQANGLDTKRELLSRYFFILAKFGLLPSEDMKQTEIKFWQKRLENNLPLALKELKTFGKFPFLARFYQDQMNKLAEETSQECRFNNQDVSWYVKEDLTFGRIRPSEVDISLDNLALKRVCYTMSCDSKGFYLVAERYGGGRYKGEALFSVQEAFFREKEKFYLDDRGKVELSPGFYLEYEIRDGFVLFRFCCNADEVQAFYKKTINELWLSHEEHEDRYFLLGNV